MHTSSARTWPKLLSLLGLVAILVFVPKSLLMGLLIRITEALDRRVGWHRLPVPLGLVSLIAIRAKLRQQNLHDTGVVAPAGLPGPGGMDPRYLTVRTPDGTFNDLETPAMGSAGTRFGRNVPLDRTYPEGEPAILDPNPRTVSRALLTRETFQPATILNVLAAAWLQFMIRDWFSHGRGDIQSAWELPLPDDDPWPDRPMRIPRTPSDPATPSGMPPAYINHETHWWDGSQIYGSNKAHQLRVRSRLDGKLTAGQDGMLPTQFLDEAAKVPGWWLGLTLLQTLFTLEHNAICDRLRAEYPSWSDDDLFEHARLINAALIAKIHTVEWTTAILAHPTMQIAMRANWWGIAGERLYNLVGRISDSELLSGIPGSRTNHFGVPYTLTEEFVAVYRMHPLIPDDFSFRSVANDEGIEERTFRQIAGPHAHEVLQRVSMTDLLYSFGTSHPGAVTLHNFPRFLQEFERPDGKIVDLAATDILRSRELGVPRYTEFRRLLHLPPVQSFEELTDNPVWREELRRVYNDDIDRVDLTVGMFAETPPKGFGFSDTAFRIFALMASRRLNSDRFLTADYNAGVYTQTGLDWIDDNDMSSVLLRHYPALRPALRTVKNAFAPWDRVSG